MATEAVAVTVTVNDGNNRVFGTDHCLVTFVFPFFFPFIEGDGGRRVSWGLPSAAGGRLQEEPVDRDHQASAARRRTQRQKGESDEPKAHPHWVSLVWSRLGWYIYVGVISTSDTPSIM